MSGDGDKPKRRRGAFARPGDPLDLAPLPFSTPTRSPSPPEVEMPAPQVRPRLDEPVEDSAGASSVNQTLKTALGFDVDDATDVEESRILDDLQPTEEVEDAATVPTPRPLSARATVATVRKRVEQIPEDLPAAPRSPARVAVAQIRVPAPTPTNIDTIPDNLPPASLTPASEDDPGGDLANLVEVNRSEHSVTPRYGHDYPNDDEVSVFDSHSDNSLFDLTARQHHPEHTEDPPSDVVEFGPISAHKDLIVREESKRAFSNRPRSEDATVFTDERRVARQRGPTNHAWWERDTAGATSATANHGTPPEDRKTWRTPGQLDLRKRTAQRERNARFMRLGLIVLALLLISVGAFALVKDSPPKEVAPETTSALGADVQDEPIGPTEDAPLETEPLPEEPETPVEPPVVEPPVVEPPVEEPSIEPPPPVEGPPPAVEQPVAATEALEEQAHKALYETGVLVVTSNPRALVWVDGERVGYTPIQALELEPGTHRLKATVPGRPPKYQTVRVDPGGAHQVPFDF